MMNRLRSFVNADNETDVWECRQDCTTLQISSWNNEMDPSSVFIFDSHGDGPIETSMVTSQSHHDDLLYNCYYEGIPNLRSIMSEEESSVDSSSSSSASSPQSPNVRKSCLTGLQHSQDPDAGRVRFSSVQVREHSIMIGNHPCCRDSLPISLDWVHSDDLCFDIEDFEYSRNMAGGRGPRGNLPRMDFWSRRVRLQTVAGMSERDFIREEQRRRQEAEREAMAYDSFRPEPIAASFPNVVVDKPIDEIRHNDAHNDHDDAGWINTEKETLDKAFKQSNYNEPAALFHSWEEEEKVKWQHHYESDPTYFDFATPPSFPSNMLDIQVLED